MQALPFHLSRNLIYQSMSALASLFKLMWWSSFWTVVDKSIKCLIKVLPNGITLAANESLPIRDKSSHFLHFLQPVQNSNNGSNSSSFSDGRLTAIVIVSFNIPRKTKQVVVPIILSGARGIPNNAKTCFIISICSPHLSESVSLVKKKLSR